MSLITIQHGRKEPKWVFPGMYLLNVYNSELNIEQIYLPLKEEPVIYLCKKNNSKNKMLHESKQYIANNLSIGLLSTVGI